MLQHRNRPDTDDREDGLRDEEEIIEDLGPLDDTFLDPAPSQELHADDEPGGMFGSTADELLGSQGPDGIDLGATESDFAGIRGDMGEKIAKGASVDLLSGRNVRGSDGLEDMLSTDLPIGGAYGDGKPIVDPATGELTDYDDPDGSPS